MGLQPLRREDDLPVIGLNDFLDRGLGRVHRSNGGLRRNWLVQRFLHLRCCALVWHTGAHSLGGENVANILVGFGVLSDQIQLAVHVGDKIFQRLVDLCLGVAASDRQVLSGNVELRFLDGFP